VGDAHSAPQESVHPAEWTRDQSALSHTNHAHDMTYTQKKCTLTPGFPRETHVIVVDRAEVIARHGLALGWGDGVKVATFASERRCAAGYVRRDHGSAGEVTSLLGDGNSRNNRAPAESAWNQLVDATYEIIAECGLHFALEQLKDGYDRAPEMSDRYRSSGPGALRFEVCCRYPSNYSV